jgi:signal transduction histidine kinase
VGGRQRNRGLGLGLFVAREIATAHGGTITATSKLGEGTIFTVRLPAEGSRAHPRSADPGARPARSSTRAAKPRTGAAKAPSA